nr:hypothetical protein [Tanacetum cinerariifolium]
MSQTVEGSSTAHIPGHRNKSDLDKISIDDLYNNFKIIEQEVKRNAGPSSSFDSQNVAFVSTLSTSNNDDVSTIFGVSTASSQVSTTNLSHATMYAFLDNQPNASQLVHEDLEQIHEDDLEQMDLKWQMALLSMRAKRLFRKTGKKITIYGSDTASYDKANVECFNYHKIGHFARECKVPRNQETRNHKKDNNDILIKDSEIAVLKSKLEKIRKEKDDIEIKIEKFQNASQILDKLIGIRITDKSKRGLGYVSYNDIPPPHTGRFSPSKNDLSHTGLPEFTEPSVESYRVKPIEVVTQTSSVKISEHVKENNDAPLIKECESQGEDEVESPPKIERKTVKSSVDKVEVDIHKQNDKPARRPIKYAEMYTTQRPRGNQRN